MYLIGVFIRLNSCLLRKVKYWQTLNGTDTDTANYALDWAVCYLVSEIQSSKTGADKDHG